MDRQDEWEAKKGAVAKFLIDLEFNELEEVLSMTRAEMLYRLKMAGLKVLKEKGMKQEEIDAEFNRLVKGLK